MRSLPVTFLLLLFAWTMHTWAERGRIRQKRAWIIDSFSIEEEKPGPFPYKLGRIVLDRKYLVLFKLYGHGVDKEPKNVLTIDKDTGDLYVHGKVDYEALDDSKSLKLHFEALNRSNNAVDTRLGVDIKVLDINDNPPVFQQPNYEVTVEESHAQGKEILTVLASDKDDSTTANGTFSFTIKSVTPKTDNVEFYIRQREGSGTVYFNGCLDYEKAQKYTILIEAKDHGEKKQLSSTSTVTVKISDKNNHLPEFSGQTGSGKVKERDTGTEVLRLKVTDKDSRGSEAWKAKYTILGDKKEIFKIITDPATNEGILTVVKPMDFEEQTYQNLSISVQNEAPYFSCKIIKRTPDAMWELDKSLEPPGTTNPDLYKSVPVTIYVEDVNDPPVFIPSVKEVVIMENTPEGTYLTTVTAKDVDGTHGNTFKYVIGEDVAGWLNVDAKTGNISTAKILDRESPFVINNTYKAIVYAVDDEKKKPRQNRDTKEQEGEPPVTGTGTVLIYLRDQNDNKPKLTENHVDVCLNKKPSVANITAVDLDLPPYSSPFHYELLGNVKGKWRIDPAHGITVQLVPENVYSGHHFLQIKVSDQQGFYDTQNLSVTVCDCSSHSNCHARMVSGARMGSDAAWIIILAVLFFIAMLLITLYPRKKVRKIDICYKSIGSLSKTNTEYPGTDCKVPNILIQNPQSSEHFQKSSMARTNTGRGGVAQVTGLHRVAQSNKHRANYFNRSGVNKATGLYSVAQSYHINRPQWNRSTAQTNKIKSGVVQMTHSNPLIVARSAKNIKEHVDWKIYGLPEEQRDYPVYLPYQYDYEGRGSDSESLDQLTVSNLGENMDFLQNLGPKFYTLGGICQQGMSHNNARY